MVDALVPAAPAEPAVPVPVPATTVNVPAPAAEAAIAAPVLSVVAAMPRDDRQLAELRQEVAGMRQLIEREMNRFTDERLRGSPVRANALDLMDEYGFDAGLARDVAVQMPADIDPARARGLMLGLISKKLPIAPVDPIEAGGVIALVGPTGAGNPGPAYPHIGGQHAMYVTQRLQHYQAGQTQETDPSQFRIMAQVAGKLTEQEIQALASYVQGLHARADDVAVAAAR